MVQKCNILELALRKMKRLPKYLELPRGLIHNGEMLRLRIMCVCLEILTLFTFAHVQV